MRATLEEVGGHVALGGVGQEHDDQVTRMVGLGGEHERRVECRSRRRAGQNALLARQTSRTGERLLIADGDYLVDDRAVEHLGNEANADARNVMRASRPAGESTMTAPGISATSCRARATASPMSMPGVSSTTAPRCWSSAMRSVDIVSDMVRMSR